MDSRIIDEYEWPEIATKISCCCMASKSPTPNHCEWNEKAASKKIVCFVWMKSCFKENSATSCSPLMFETAKLILGYFSWIGNKLYRMRFRRQFHRDILCRALLSSRCWEKEESPKQRKLAEAERRRALQANFQTRALFPFSWWQNSLAPIMTENSQHRFAVIHGKGVSLACISSTEVLPMREVAVDLVSLEAFVKNAEVLTEWDLRVVVEGWASGRIPAGEPPFFSQVTPKVRDKGRPRAPAFTRVCGIYLPVPWDNFLFPSFSNSK